MKYEDPMIEKNSFGCDFNVRLCSEGRNEGVKILQLTDPQIIDSSQRRSPDRLDADSVRAYAPENFDIQCANHIRSLITQTDPDMIFITGDIIYGEFDDAGTSILRFAEFMDSFGIPWAPVFGNHDNESAIGVSRQCEIFESCRYCLFKRGNVTGNGNYSVVITMDGKPLRVIHMLDSNGCKHSADPSVTPRAGLYPDQLEQVEKCSANLRGEYGPIPGFMAFHIPHSLFTDAEREKGYVTDERYYYLIGVNVEAKDGDFGFKLDSADSFRTSTDLLALAKRNGIDGIFIGHHHNTSTCVNYHGIRLVYGLKTGQYDSYIPGNIGGTLITLEKENYTVRSISSMCPYGPVPKTAVRYKNFFLQSE